MAVQHHVYAGLSKHVLVEHVCTCGGALYQCFPGTKSLETAHQVKPMVYMVLQHTEWSTSHKIFISYG
jgi:hypothetical protein